MLGVRQRRHVALRHEAFFVSRQNTLCCRVFFNPPRLRSVNHEQFPMQIDTEKQAQQVAGNPRRRRFSTETPLENAYQNSSQAHRRRQTRSRENIA